MKSSVFALIILCFTFAIFQSYQVFRSHYSGVDGLKVRVSELRAQVEREKLKRAVAEFEIEGYRQNVATLLPGELKKNDRYSLRNLASVSSAPDTELLQIEPANGLFEAGKKKFKGQYFEESNRIFKQIVDQYPHSIHIVESHFLLSEGLFQIHEYEACIDVIEAMVALFPENDLTGFALMRLGTIFQERERLEDAVEIYRSVLATYKNNPTLVQQAKNSLSQVEL